MPPESKEEPKENPQVNPQCKRARKPKAEKLTFGRFNRVKLTQEEHDKLIAENGDRGHKAIAKLDAWLEAKGDKYKSHYAAMHTWVLRAVDEDTARAQRASPQTPGQRRFQANEQAAWEFINDPTIGARQ